MMIAGIIRIEKDPNKAEKKHSRRYKAVDEEFPIQTVYVSRPFANDKNNLKITIEEE